MGRGRARRRGVLGVAVATLVLSGAALPADAVSAKASTGTVAFVMDSRCSVTLKGPGSAKTKTKVPKSGKVNGLKPGTYSITLKPKSSCQASSKKITVKKGKTAKATVYYDLRIVPLTVSGSFSGGFSVDGQSRATWSGQVSLAYDPPSGTGNIPGFETYSYYRPTAFSGNWSINFTTNLGECTHVGSGTFSIDILRKDSTGAPDWWWTNPWAAGGTTYAWEAVTNETMWPYTRTCTDPVDGSVEVTQQSMPAAFRLLSTNQWDGTTAVAPPVSPPDGTARFAGTYVQTLTGTVNTWTWDLAGPDGALGQSVSRPG